MKRLALIAATAALLATPAYAGHCPKDAKALDNGLAVLKVSDDVKKQVTELKTKAMDLHAAGKHEESEDMLAEAMRTLLSAVK